MNRDDRRLTSDLRHCVTNRRTIVINESRVFVRPPFTYTMRNNSLAAAFREISEMKKHHSRRPIAESKSNYLLSECACVAASLDLHRDLKIVNVAASIYLSTLQRL